MFWAFETTRTRTFSMKFFTSACKILTFRWLELVPKRLKGLGWPQVQHRPPSTAAPEIALELVVCTKTNLRLQMYADIRSPLSLPSRPTRRPTVPTKKGSRVSTQQSKKYSRTWFHKSSRMWCFRQLRCRPFRRPFPPPLTKLCGSLTKRRLKVVLRTIFALPILAPWLQRPLWACIVLWEKASKTPRRYHRRSIAPTRKPRRQALVCFDSASTTNPPDIRLYGSFLSNPGYDAGNVMKICLELEKWS